MYMFKQSKKGRDCKLFLWTSTLYDPKIKFILNSCKNFSHRKRNSSYHWQVIYMKSLFIFIFWCVSTFELLIINGMKFKVSEEVGPKQTRKIMLEQKSKRRKYNECMHVFYTSRDQEQFSITYKLWMFNISHGKSLKWPAFYLSCSVNTIAKHGIFFFLNVRIF